MRTQKKPLYRKVNTRARGVHHNSGGDFRHDRRKDNASNMKQGVKRGLDYTPLYKFLLSKIGKQWDDVHSEAVSRLDKEDPIFNIVSLDFESANDYVWTGESTYYSGLYVDDRGILQKVNPDVNETTLTPVCKCCTHTFNGVVFTKKYVESE